MEIPYKNFAISFYKWGDKDELKITQQVGLKNKGKKTRKPDILQFWQSLIFDKQNQTGAEKVVKKNNVWVISYLPKRSKDMLL